MVPPNRLVTKITKCLGRLSGKTGRFRRGREYIVGVGPMRYGDDLLCTGFLLSSRRLLPVNQNILGDSTRKMPWSGNFAIEPNVGAFSRPEVYLDACTFLERSPPTSSHLETSDEAGCAW